MKNQSSSARDRLVDALRGFLVGPYAGDPAERIYAGYRAFKGERTLDTIEQTPFDFYHTGYLSPLGTAVDAEEDDQERQDPDIDYGSGEGIMTMANAAQQAAMGFTCQVQNLDAVIEFCATWGEYGLVADENGTSAPSQENEEDANGGRRRIPLEWRREPQRMAGRLTVRDIPEEGLYRVADQEDVLLQVRRRTRRDLIFLTATVVNRRRRPRDGSAGDNRIYQVRLSAAAVPEASPVFVSSPNTARRDEGDFWREELLFRDARQFAVGHGCSVMWELAGDRQSGGRFAHAIRTEWVPECEVYKASAAVLSGDRVLDVEWLADPDHKAETMAALRRLEAAYTKWIGEGRDAVAGICDEFSTDVRESIRKAADGNLDACEEQRRRIGAGIRFLEDDQDNVAFEAFCLANRAMASAMRKRRPDSAPRWYAFQLAFILLALPSVADPDHDDRRLLDLIWFPTGGGKTEAYLGLTAFTIFHRGLSVSSPGEASGTSVLTRYTLRLLTVQQFERAALTILSCERIRRAHPQLRRHAPYGIGLLVGKKATPNWVEDARKIHEGEGGADGSTLLPLEKCPWCDAALDLGCLSFADKEMVTRCPTPSCEFHDGIPVSIIDEQILSSPPTFVIATIDKLAQMPWEYRLGRLFGYGEPQRRPPDLIIQDELHLIGDSLGTIAALYETAIDWLCSHGGRGPKIVGSTATIRRAEEHSASLFQREARQFPPSGTDANDSFFYAQDTSEPGRLYVGVHAQGRSPKHTLPRIIGTLAQTAEGISPPEVRDHYYTLVTYFNSLRELGGALVIAEDDVPRYIDSLPIPEGSRRRRLSQKVELTSVVDSGQIPDILRRMEVPSDEPREDLEPLDLVLCTNMISVGVDVDRLGAMIVVGQPKTTAEYIQASSRVGRPKGSAGLVVTQYNWTRPRDRSHYERFVGYHSAFYRYVEAVSVTPFSDRARDRALQAVLASLVRIGIPAFSDNGSPVRLERPGELWDEVRRAANVILERVRDVDSRETEDAAQDLDRLLEDWLEEASFCREDGRPLYWTPWGVPREEKSRSHFMLEADGFGSGPEGLWPAMLSMRDVDPPAPVRLLRSTDRS